MIPAGGRLDIGPDADAFRATFGVGRPDAPIHPVDGIGVALAAIQGAYEMIVEQSQELARLRELLDAAERAVTSRRVGE